MKTYTEYPAYWKALEQLSKIDARIQVLESEANGQQAKRQDITDQLETAEADLILGRIDESAVVQLRKELDKLPNTDTRELSRQRAAASILRSELPALKQQAITQFCASKKPAYSAALKGLEKALYEAQAKYADVQRLFNEAAKISPTHSMILEHGGVFNPDIPAACGLEPFGIELFTKPEPNVWSDDLRTHAEKIRAAIAEFIDN